VIRSIERRPTNRANLKNRPETLVHARYALIPSKEAFEIHTEELDPAMLGPNQALVRAEATMVSAGTELAAFTALSKNVYIPGRWNSYPWRPGYGLVGRIEAVGPGEEKLRAGDRVFCFGKHASVQIYDYSGNKPMNGIFVIDEEVDAVVAATARMVLVALTAPQITGVEAGDTVAVFGLGMVGALAALLYQLAGARVIGLDTSGGRCRAAREAGLREVVDVAPDAQVKAIEQLTGGNGVDIAVDSVGHSAVIQNAVAATATYGRVVLLGSPRVPFEGNMTDVWNRIHMQSLAVLGALEWRLPRHPTRGVKHSVASNLGFALDLVRSRRLDALPLVSHVVPLERRGEAYPGMLSDKDQYRGVVVDFR
jgi:2-desacetyl-2-hydroxyethyl bacteriochlorophyllide A dehydrogenase